MFDFYNMLEISVLLIFAIPLCQACAVKLPILYPEIAAFALRNQGFWTVKACILRRKTMGFAS